MVQPHLPTVYVRERLIWEYHLLKVGNDKLPDEKALNALGEDGWEMAGIFAGPAETVYYFKRIAG
jgi:hypothetical protein